MDTNPQTPNQLFGKDVHYSIPAYQRRYVWTQEAQWEPLWADAVNVTEKIIGGQAATFRPHFLGAVVLQDLPKKQTEPPLQDVIDGQQRLTTLQVLLRAVADSLSAHQQRGAAFLERLIENDQLFWEVDKRFRFKISPTRHDRAAFEHIMVSGDPGQFSESKIASAYHYFRQEVDKWLDGQDPEALEDRSNALVEVLKDKLIFIVIDTQTEDDSNLIFETLNARGTPLLAWDLIKNYMINHLPQQTSLNLEQFDDDWWQADIGRNRDRRSRIDNLLITWLEMRVQSTVETRTQRNIFDAFDKYVKAHDGATEAVTEDLIRVSDDYRKMLELDDSSTLGSFLSHWRVLPHGAFDPVVLWLIAELNEADDIEMKQQGLSLEMIESYFVRRLITGDLRGGGGADLVRLAFDLLELLSGSPAHDVGRQVVKFFGDLSEKQNRLACPGDDVLQKTVGTDYPIFRRLNRRQTSMVLRSIEEYLHSGMSELSVPSNLTIEHLLPQSWSASDYPHPDVYIATDEEAIAERRVLINTIGNLTLVTHKLNASLSNGPWQQKRQKLNQYGVLLMNKTLESNENQHWDENSIRKRSAELAEICAQIWKTPEKLR